MKKKLLYIALAFSSYASAQVGIGTVLPKATLDINGSPLDITKIDGIIPPRITREQLAAKTNYAADQEGAIVYVTEVGESQPTNKVIKVMQEGYYYYDGNLWQPIAKEPWRVKGTNKEATDNTQDIYQKGKVGIQTENPVYDIDIEGTARLSPDVSANNSVAINSSYTSLYINKETGALIIPPAGFGQSVGGFRPYSNDDTITSRQIVVKELDKKNTILTVRFVLYPDNSNYRNNAISAAYTYGSFTIVGTSPKTENASAAEIEATNSKIIEYSIKDYDGNPKTLSIDTPMKKAFVQSTDGNSLGTASISLENHPTKADTVNLVLTLDTANVFSYFFDFLGGS